MKKSDLRKIYLARRKNFSPAERRRASRRIVERFFADFDLSNVNYLHCFLPIERFGEVETKLIFERVWRDFPGVVTLAPRVDFQTGEIENLRFAPETALAPNAWQIIEPVGGEAVSAEKIDSVLIPLLCFDRRGYRVGYGKGFYDKLLSRCRADCLKIGLSFFEPIETIAADARFDVKLDCCVTPEKTYRFKF